MAGINLPDLVQKIKIDTKDMLAAAAQATAFGQKMKAISKDVDDSSNRIAKSLNKINDDLDRNARTVASTQQGMRRDFESGTRSVNLFADSLGQIKMTKVDVDTKPATTKLAQLDRAIGSRHPEIGVGLEVDDYEYRALQERLRRAQLKVGVEAELQQAKIRAQMEALERKRQVQIEADLDGAAKVESALDVVARDRHATVHVNTDKSDLDQITATVTKIAGILTGLGNTGGLGFWKGLAMPAGMVSGIMAAIPLVGALGNSIQVLSQVALAAPAALAGMGAAFGPLGLALIGMKDATDKATKSFMTSMENIGKSWDKVRAQMRGELFEGLGRALTDLNRTAIPQLRGGLLDVSRAWNEVALKFVDFAKQPAVMNQLKTILGQTVPLISIFGQHLTGSVQAFLNLAQAGMPAFARLGDVLTGVIKKFTDWTAQGLKDGSIGRMIDEGVVAFQRLLGVIGTVVQAFKGMWGAAQLAGVDFIGVLETTADWLSRVFNNPTMQRGLADAFIGVRSLVGGLLGDIRPVVSIFGDLGAIIRTVGGYLGQVASSALPYIATGFHNLSGGIASMATAMGPFIEVINAIGPAFVKATSAVGPFLTSVANFVGGAVANLAPVVKNVADTIAVWLPKAFDLGRAAMDSFGRAIEYIAPTLSRIVDFVRPVVSGLLDFATAAIRMTGPLLPIAVGVLALAKAFAVLKTAVMGSAAMQGIIGFATALRGIPFGPVTTQMGGFSSAIGRFVGSMQGGAGVMASFKGLLGGMLGGFNLVTAALMAAGAAFVWYSSYQDAANQGAKAFKDTLDKTTGAVTSMSQEWAKSKLLEDITEVGEWEGFKKFGIDINEAAAAIAAGGPALDQFRAKFDAARESARASGVESEAAQLPWNELGNAISHTATEADRGRGMMDLLGVGSDTAAASTKTLTDALTKVGQETANSTTEVKKFSDALAALNNPALAARQAQRDWKASLQESTSAQKEWLTTHKSMKGALNENTEAGRQNLQVLDNMAQAALRNVAAAQEHGASQATLSRMLDSARTSLMNQAEAWGMSEAQAKAYVDEVLQVPKNADTTLNLFSDTAMEAIKFFNLELAKLPSTTQVRVNAAGDIETFDTLTKITTAIGRLPKNTKLVVQADGTAALVPIKNINDEVAAVNKTKATVEISANGAQATITDINGVVTTLGSAPAGKEFYITADNKLAIRDINAVNDKKMEPKKVEIGADSSKAKQEFDIIDGRPVARKTAYVDGNSDAAQQEFAFVDGVKIPRKTATIDGDNKPALSAIDSILTRSIPPKTVSITGNNVGATASIDEILRRNVPPKVVSIAGNNSGATSSIDEIIRRSITPKTLTIGGTNVGATSAIDRTNARTIPNKTLTIGGNNVGATSAIDRIIARTLPNKTQYIGGNNVGATSAIDRVIARSLPQKTQYIGGNNAGATSAIDRIISRGLPSKTVYINGNAGGFYSVASRVASWAATVYANIKGIFSKADGGLVFPQAEGSIFNPKRFAGGAENHIAQIAPAGAWRMWAEPETGGESYIPLAPWKRKRSREIWALTGHYLGFDDEILRALMRMDTGGLLSQQAQYANRQAPIAIKSTPAPSASASVEPPVIKNFYFNFEVNNPVAETSSETAVKEVTRLAALGVFR